MSYKCDCCGEIFDEPSSKSYCHEEYCGVSSMFSNKHYGSYDVCPRCGSEDFDDYCDEDEEEYEDE